MNESTVIIIFVAANPSKDIPRARKKLSEKRTNWRLSIAPQAASDPHQTQTPAGIWVF